MQQEPIYSITSITIRYVYPNFGRANYGDNGVPLIKLVTLFSFHLNDTHYAMCILL